MEKEEILKQCTVQGMIVKLPDIQLERKLYQDVAKSLEIIGGKWKGGKIAGFVFPHDPTELLAEISNGEKRNLKKEFQFFATPPDIAKMLVALLDPTDEDLILEPSAGSGALMKAVLELNPIAKIQYCEIMPTNGMIILNNFGLVPLCEDFLELDTNIKFDKIIANPPFSNNQDIDHICKMYLHLKPGGTLVSVSSAHWPFSNNSKEIRFRLWLEKCNAWVNVIEKGAFKDSGTLVESRVIVIQKQHQN